MYSFGALTWRFAQIGVPGATDPHEEEPFQHVQVALGGLSVDPGVTTEGVVAGQ